MNKTTQDMINKILVWLGLLKYKVMLDTEYLNNTTMLDNGYFQSDCVLFTNFDYPCGYSIHDRRIKFWRDGGNKSIDIDYVNEWIIVP